MTAFILAALIAEPHLYANVEKLQGGFLRLVNDVSDGSDTAPVKKSGRIQFLAEYQVGQQYRVVVKDQPAKQTCAVIGGEGVFADKDVIVRVVCAEPSFASTAGGKRRGAAVGRDHTLWMLPAGERMEQVGSANDWQAVATSGSHTLAIRADGSLWGFGSNTAGELGQPASPHALPVQRIGDGTTWKSVAAGGRSSAAIDATGGLFTFGDGIAQVPTRLGGEDWSTVAIGVDHFVAIKKDGSLWSWGTNKFSQLGDGATAARAAPARVGTDADWQLVAAGAKHSVAVKKDGSLWTWGCNGNGQLGIGNGEYIVGTPTRVGTAKWKWVAAGETQTVGIQVDGSLWELGTYSYPALTDAAKTKAQRPQRVGKGKWLAAAATERTAYAIDANGKLSAWGVLDDRVLRLSKVK